MDKKQNQPLELEELDLALPDDLNLGEADVDSGFDDLELPELTADDDLGELGSADTHAGEEMHSPHDSMTEAEPMDTELHEAAPHPINEDEEPIALSEEELERIVGTKDSELFSDFQEGEHPPEHTDLDFSSEGESDEMQSDLDADISEAHAEPESDFGDMRTDLEDEGPVSLSEEELGNILGDVGESVDMPGEDHHADHADLDMHSDLDSAPAASASAMDESEDESITLSDDELNNILLDSGDLESARGEPKDAPPLSELSMDEEDGPIALTAEELGNIISDVHEEVEAPEKGEHFDSEMHEEMAAPSLLDEEDEGPVALSDAELDSILEDVHEEVPAEQAGMHADSRANLIVLDEYEDREIAEEKPAIAPQPERFDHVAAEASVPKDDLRKMISYLDQLFDKLPEDTVREFSRSEYFDLYKKIMEDLNLT